MTCESSIALKPQINQAYFLSRMPYLAYCSNDLQYGLKRIPREYAIMMQHIQPNPDTMQWCIIIDLDYDGAAFAPQDAGLPPPAYTIINREGNRHAHVIYPLRSPICTSSNAHAKPMLYISAIEDAYTLKLGGDLNYTGLISKNPYHDCYDVWEDGNAVYNLDELAEAVDLPKPKKQTQKIENAESRNCNVFDSLRFWAYRAVRDYWRPDGDKAWLDACIGKAIASNTFVDEHGHTLDNREIVGIARSVWRWTWRYMSPSGLKDFVFRTHTPEKQRARIQKRWGNKEDEGFSMIKQGKTNAEIAKALQTTDRTVTRWRKKIKSVAP